MCCVTNFNFTKNVSFWLFFHQASKSGWKCKTHTFILEVATSKLFFFLWENYFFALSCDTWRNFLCVKFLGNTLNLFIFLSTRRSWQCWGCFLGFFCLLSLLGNLLYVQWLESVGLLRLLLEQLGRSLQSLLIRCVDLICLSAPQERSWSRCFSPSSSCLWCSVQGKKEGEGFTKREEFPGVPAYRFSPASSP